MAELTNKQKAAMWKRIDSYMAKLSDIKSYTINEDMSIDVVGNVKLNKKAQLNKDCQLPYQFGKVDGDFVLEGLPLFSLVGCPSEVTGKFEIGVKYDGSCRPIDANFFSTLEGAPKKVGGDCIIKYAHVTSLNGCPSEVGGLFECRSCPIESLVGMPKKMDGDVEFSSIPSLTTLVGAPEEVGGDFRCFSCGITNWEGLPKKVGGKLLIASSNISTLEGVDWNYKSLDISSNKNTDLKGLPKVFDGDLECGGKSLTSLEGAPQKVTGNFIVSYSQITTLQGAPQEVGGNFKLTCNDSLTNLEGSPQVVGGELSFYRNEKLANLEGFPKKVGGNIRIRAVREFTVEEIQACCEVGGTIYVEKL